MLILSGRVCVPFDPSKAEQFNPDEVKFCKNNEKFLELCNKVRTKKGLKKKEINQVNLF